MKTTRPRFPHTQSALLLVLALLALCFTSAPSPAQSCVDQQYTTTRANGLEITGNQSAVQTFTVGQSGLLARVDADLRHHVANVTTPLTVNILATDPSGTPTNQVLATTQVPATDIPTGPYALVPIRFPQPIPVTTGTVLGLELQVPAAITRAYAWSGDAPGSYARGTTFIRRTTGPLSFDMGFRTHAGPVGASLGYGQGHPGTLGVPSCTASAPPRLGVQIDLLAGNSSPAATAGVLLLGTARVNLPTPFGGTLLVQPRFDPIAVPLPVGGARVPLAVPDDHSLCGQVLDLQLLVIDAGASHGVAFSAGLELQLGQ